MTLEVICVPWQNLEESSHRRASCFVVSSSSQFAISFFFFFDNLGYALGQIVSGCEACSFVCKSTFFTPVSPGVFQSILLRAHVHFPHSNSRSACARRRCLCTLASASSRRRISKESKSCCSWTVQY